MAHSFEAKLHGFRRTQDGVVISYVVHPNDVSMEMATAVLGTRYMIGAAEIGDDEKPTGGLVQSGAEATRNAEVNHVAEQLEDTGSSPVAPARKFSQFPFSQQAALRCKEKQFQEFLMAATEDRATEKVRLLCDIETRKNLDSFPPARLKWQQIEAEYQTYLTDQRYAHVMRK